jgi:uncharacterized protein (TIGR03435 family)
VSVPVGQNEGLQQAIREKLGLMARLETQEQEVYVLKSTPGDFPGLQRSQQNGTSSTSTEDGSFRLVNATIGSLLDTLEVFLGRPVVNGANLTGRFDISCTWSDDEEGLKRSLREQLGLEVITDKREVETLLVEKAP